LAGSYVYNLKRFTDSAVAYFLGHLAYRVAQKSKPLPNDQKNVLKPVNEIDLFIKLMYESSTIILFVGIRYSVHDLLSDLNNYD